MTKNNVKLRSSFGVFLKKRFKNIGSSFGYIHNWNQDSVPGLALKIFKSNINFFFIMQKFILKHTIDSKNAQTNKKKEKGELTGCQVNSYKFGISYTGSKIQI